MEIAQGYRFSTLGLRSIFITVYLKSCFSSRNNAANGEYNILSINGR
jgi:hypothetical protein